MLIFRYYHSILHISHNLRILHIRLERMSLIRRVTSRVKNSNYISSYTKNMDADKNKISFAIEKSKVHRILLFVLSNRVPGSLLDNGNIVRGKVITKRISNNLHLPTRL